MKYIKIWLLIFSLTNLAHAQVNMESDRGGEKEGVGVSSEFGFTLQDGNVKVLTYLASLRVDYVDMNNHYYLIGSAIYGEQDAEEFKNQGFAHLRWTHIRWFFGPEFFIQVEHDKFKSLGLRQLNGIGLRAEPMKSMAFGFAGMSDYERIKSPLQSNLDWRASTYVSVNQDWNGLKFNLVSYYQPLFNDPEDFRLLSIAYMGYPISKSFSIINQFNYAYDTNPPDGVVKKDVSVMVKFSLKSWVD